MASSTIYIIYNAKASFAGKASYAFRKLTESSTPCAACDLTHGGLSLTETPKWTETKKKIGAEVRQLHTDELTPEIIDFAAKNTLKYPVVLGKGSGGQLQLLMTRDDLVGCNKDHEEFLTTIKSRAAEKDVSLDVTAAPSRS